LKKIIFNSSLPRSGSELLQVILHQNPKIYASSTSPLLEYQYGARGNYELPEVKSQEPQLMQKAFIRMCKYMAQGYYDLITDRDIVCDKNRGWCHYYEWVGQWYPNPKMICMVRDIRSIIASMERIYRKNRHRPAGPDNPQEIKNMTVEQRTIHWLNTQPVGLALSRTLDLIQRGVDKNILFIKYEALVSEPQKTMNRVYDYIEEERHEHDFSNLKKEVYEDSSHFGVYGDHAVAASLKPLIREDWQDMLGRDMSLNIKEGSKWFYSYFNYQH
jgi:sulfotransferase